jgi:hypothetical protein
MGDMFGVSVTVMKEALLVELEDFSQDIGKHMDEATDKGPHRCVSVCIPGSL